MNAVQIAMWLLLSALCVAQAISKVPRPPPKKWTYLVCYESKIPNGGGLAGDIIYTCSGPLNDAIRESIRSSIKARCVEAGDIAEGQQVVFRSITEIQP